MVCSPESRYICRKTTFDRLIRIQRAMITCFCDDHFEVSAVGEPRIVIARTARACSDCGGPIPESSVMYVQSFYNFVEGCTCKPYYMCERCGDLIESISEQGYCVEYGNVVKQWFDYIQLSREQKEGLG